MSAVDLYAELHKHGDLRNLSPAALGELTDHPDWGIRFQVAMEPRTPVEALARLARDGSEEVRQGAAANSALPDEVRAELAGAAEPGVRAVVAGNESASVEVLARLADDGEPSVRAAVAANVATPAALLSHLSEDTSEVVRVCAASNPSTPANAHGRLATDTSSKVREQIAQDASTPVNMLGQLARDKKAEVRLAVATNRNCPSAALDLLIADRSWKVRQMIARLRYRRFYTTDVHVPASLSRLAGDDHWQVREQLARHPAAASETLTVLSEDVNERVRHAVAANHHTPPETLAILASDSNLLVRSAVSQNPCTSTEMLVRLLQDPYSGIHRTVAVRLARQALVRLLEESMPRRLKVVERPRIQLRESQFICDIAVLDSGGTSIEEGAAIDPATLHLAVGIVPPNTGTPSDRWQPSFDSAQLVRYAESGIRSFWRLELKAGAAVSALRLEGGAYEEVASAGPGTLLTLDDPFPISFDPAVLVASDADRLVSASGEDMGTAGDAARPQDAQPETLARMAQATNAAIREEAASSRDAPPEILSRLATDGNWHVRRKAAAHARTPPQSLVALAKDSNWHVRFAVAGNSRTPVEQLVQLSGDERWEVRRVAATNSSTPKEALHQLAQDPRREVRHRVASLLRTPSQVLRQLGADPDRQIRREVASNRATPPDVLAKLASEVSEGIPVAEDPDLKTTAPYGTSLARVGGIIGDTMGESVRFRVAKNQSAPREALESLSESSDERIRSAATAQLMWRNLLSILEQVAPRRLTVTEAALIRLGEGKVVRLRAAVVQRTTESANPSEVIEPREVSLVLDPVWPWSTLASGRSAGYYIECDIPNLWRVDLGQGPTISVFRLEDAGYVKVCSAEPGNPLVLDEPFSVALDPADLWNRSS
jgi:hypothetical protein